MRRTHFISSAFLVVTLFAGFALADGTPQTRPAAVDFGGTYRDSHLTVQIVHFYQNGSDTSYVGKIILGEQQFPITGFVAHDQMHGTFHSGDNSFTFDATLAGDELVFQTGGTVYHLKNFHPANEPPKSGNIVGKWLIKGDLGGEDFTLTLSSKGEITLESSHGNSCSGPTFHCANNTLTFDGSIGINQLSLGGTWNLKWVSEDEFTTTDNHGKPLTLHRIVAAR